MSYTVTIAYAGKTPEAVRIANQICGMFDIKGSYIDTAAYSGSVYDTNVEGWGYIAALEPFKTTSVPFPSPLAQFKLAVVGTDNSVTFTVDTYYEAFYYATIGEQLKDQGFTVTVAEVTPEEEDDDQSPEDQSPENPGT